MRQFYSSVGPVLETTFEAYAGKIPVTRMDNKIVNFIDHAADKVSFILGERVREGTQQFLAKELPLRIIEDGVIFTADSNEDPFPVDTFHTAVEWMYKEFYLEAQYFVEIRNGFIILADPAKVFNGFFKEVHEPTNISYLGGLATIHPGGIAVVRRSMKPVRDILSFAGLSIKDFPNSYR